MQRMSGNNTSTRFPGHALHEKGLQRQMGVGTLVSSQERRAPLVQQINRRRTGRERDVNRGFCSSVGVKNEFDCSCFRRNVQGSVLGSLGGKRESSLLAGSTQRRPVLPSPAPPRRPAARRPDPTGPWCVRVLGSTSRLYNMRCYISICFSRQAMDIPVSHG